jgi:hypothetical protein
MKNFIEIIDIINIDDLVDFYQKNQNQFVWNDFDKKGKQTGLQYAKNLDIWLGATDRTKIKSHNFSHINPFFENSIFENIIKKYKLFRTRFLWLNFQSCYSMHFDDTPRIHVPLITNPDAFIVFKSGLVQHLEIGKVYWVNTREMHTAINGGIEPRLHLVGCVKE